MSLTLENDTARHDICAIIGLLPRNCGSCYTTTRTLNDETNEIGEHEDDGERARCEDGIHAANDQYFLFSSEPLRHDHNGWEGD